jgi:hypothetical protein
VIVTDSRVFLLSLSSPPPLSCHLWNDLSQIRRLVKSIYSCYFAHTARQAINVDSDARAEADADILDPSSAAFASAETQVYNLMREDSYARFLRSDLFAQQVRHEIAKGTHRKDYGIVSWYKTSLKPRLSISSGKTPARCPPAPIPVSPFSRPLCQNGSHGQHKKSVQTGSQVYDNNFDSHILHSETRKHSPQVIGKENRSVNQTVRFRAHDDSDFPLPDSLWQLSDENEYEDFFCDLLTASHKSNDMRKVGAMGRRSNSHPSLADTINQVTLTSSPSLDHIRSEMANTSRSRKGVSFRSPPPPLPPKSVKPMQPLPVPAAGPSIRRTMRV